MHRYDLVIQLSSHVKFVEGQYQLAPHTRMRTEAAAIVLKSGIAPRLVISGGSNFGVRYNDQEITKRAVFTFEAFADADFYRKSEAAVIKDVLVREYGCASRQIFAETLSATTEENAEFLKIILRRRPMFTGQEKMAILTLFYHMEKALPVFLKAGLPVKPLFAENVLAKNDPSQIENICKYYSTPKGNVQFSVDRIRQLLTQGESLAAMMQ